MTVLVLVGAWIADRLLGEPTPHPLIGFGRMASQVERTFRKLPFPVVVSGILAWSVLVLVPSLVVLVLSFASSTVPGALLDFVVVYLCVAHRSLCEHALAVRDALVRQDASDSGELLARMVSRDTDRLSKEDVAKGAIESVLENGNDAVVATLFWYAALGPAAAVCHRLANTLDAMWGYRNERYLLFGRCAARMDDFLGWLPARLTAALYTAVGLRALAWRCWQEQGSGWDSPNAGPVLAAGAGALDIRLGGSVSYAGRKKTRPSLGTENAVQVSDIQRALDLLFRAAVLLFIVIGCVEMLTWR